MLVFSISSYLVRFFGSFQQGIVVFQCGLVVNSTVLLIVYYRYLPKLILERLLLCRYSYPLVLKGDVMQYIQQSQLIGSQDGSSPNNIQERFLPKSSQERFLPKSSQDRSSPKTSLLVTPNPMIYAKQLILFRSFRYYVTCSVICSQLL